MAACMALVMFIFTIIGFRAVLDGNYNLTLITRIYTVSDI